MYLSLTALAPAIGSVRQKMGAVLGFSVGREGLMEVSQNLREIEETLLGGLVPPEKRWERLRALSEPWGALAFESLTELRKSGGSLLPTLKRLRALAEDQIQAMSDARTKTSQALAQALVCAGLVPLLGLGMAALVPGIQEQARTWIAACVGALILASLGSLWLVLLSDAARWGGLALARRSWVLVSQCAGERFLAQTRSGTPPDLAWTRALESLKSSHLDLVSAWGHSVWDSPKFAAAPGIESIIVSAGVAIKKSIQVSLMEGRPCSERVESVLLAMRRDIEAQIARELNLLATRALKPLFVCVAPALLGLLMIGLWLTTLDSVGWDIFGA